MKRYQYVILSAAAEGREAECAEWYDKQHLGDVLNVDGVVAAKRYRVNVQKVTNLDAPQWQSVAIYDIESDDPEAVMAAISAAAGSEVMPMTDAITRSGLVQLLVEESCSKKKS